MNCWKIIGWYSCFFLVGLIVGTLVFVFGYLNYFFVNNRIEKPIDKNAKISRTLIFGCWNLVCWIKFSCWKRFACVFFELIFWHCNVFWLCSFLSFGSFSFCILNSTMLLDYPIRLALLFYCLYCEIHLVVVIYELKIRLILGNCIQSFIFPPNNIRGKRCLLRHSYGGNSKFYKLKWLIGLLVGCYLKVFTSYLAWYGEWISGVEYSLIGKD